MVVDFLNFILALFTGIVDLWWLTVPVVVMGIFAIVVRISLHRY